LTTRAEARASAALTGCGALTEVAGAEGAGDADALAIDGAVEPSVGVGWAFSFGATTLVAAASTGGTTSGGVVPSRDHVSPAPSATTAIAVPPIASFRLESGGGGG
jgi:hypothetical protein